MKPTYERLSKRGVFPLSRNPDHTGPITRTVTNNALLLNAIVGYNPEDPNAINVEVEDFTYGLAYGVKRSTIGVPKSFFLKNINKDIKKSFTESLEILQRLGASLRKIIVSNMEEITGAQ